MKFVREVLGTPLPEIYAWSSRAMDTPVGAEFILMEKMNGVELETVLPEMKIQDRLEVVKSIAGYQQSWVSVSFEQYGSLYFAEDIDDPAASALVYTDRDGRKVHDSRFVVGPSTGREMFDDGRSTVEFHRGPWKSLEEYHAAIGNREVVCVQQIAELPPSPVSLRGHGLYQPTREKKVKALKCYLDLFKYILPEDLCLRSAHLWHGDLHAGNIFVDPDNPTRIVGLIDWQSIELSPLYFHARQPHFIDHEGPTMHGLERPTLPPNFAQLEPNQKATAQSMFLQQSLCALYRKIIYHECPSIFQCFEFQQSPEFTLLLLARNLLVDGEASYLAQVRVLADTWTSIPGTRGSPFPLSFSAAEIREIEEDVESAALAMNTMQKVRKSLGELYPDEGYVSHDRHSKAVEAFSRVKEQVLEGFNDTRT